jgi:hypothetical protein
MKVKENGKITMSENHIEVNFDEFKFSIKQSKLSEEELSRSREETNRHKTLSNYVESSGEWWKIWEEDNVLKWLKDIGLFDSAQNAISILKDIFTSQWFKTVKVHPMKYWLLTPGLVSLSEMIRLASAIKVLSPLNDDDIEKLRSNENFIGKAYELEIIAFLKRNYGQVSRESELSQKHIKKPDAKVNDFYVEIKTLQTSKKEKEFRGALKEIYEEIDKLSKDKKGVILCTIDLGALTTLNELEQKKKIAVKLLNSIRIDEEKMLETILSENDVKIHIKYVPHPQIKVMNIQFTDYTLSGLIELDRIAIKIIEAAEKYFDYAPLVLIIQPSTPLIFLTLPPINEKLQELWARPLFSFALSQQPKTNIIKELWIDLTSMDTDCLIKCLSNPASSLERFFVKLPNPFYAVKNNNKNG